MDHVRLYYDLRVQVYSEAAELGVSIAHVVEWMLKHWWDIEVGDNIRVGD